MSAYLYIIFLIFNYFSCFFQFIKKIVYGIDCLYNINIQRHSVTIVILAHIYIHGYIDISKY